MKISQTRDNCQACILLPRQKRYQCVTSIRKLRACLIHIQILSPCFTRKVLLWLKPAPVDWIQPQERLPQSRCGNGDRLSSQNPHKHTTNTQHLLCNYKTILFIYFLLYSEGHLSFSWKHDQRHQHSSTVPFCELYRSDRGTKATWTKARAYLQSYFLIQARSPYF